MLRLIWEEPAVSHIVGSGVVRLWFALHCFTGSDWVREKGTCGISLWACILVLTHTSFLFLCLFLHWIFTWVFCHCFPIFSTHIPSSFLSLTHSSSSACILVLTHTHIPSSVVYFCIKSLHEFSVSLYNVFLFSAHTQSSFPILTRFFLSAYSCTQTHPSSSNFIHTNFYFCFEFLCTFSILSCFPSFCTYIQSSFLSSG